MKPYPLLGQTWVFPEQVCLAMLSSAPSADGNTNVGMLGKAVADDSIPHDINAAIASLALQPTAPAISPGQQDALAGDEGLAQTQAGAVQETAILPAGTANMRSNHKAPYKILKKQGRIAEAISACRHELIENPNNAAVYLEMANCFERQGKRDKALQYLNIALKTAKKTGDTKTMRSATYGMLALPMSVLPKEKLNELQNIIKEDLVRSLSTFQLFQGARAFQHMGKLEEAANFFVIGNEKEKQKFDTNPERLEEQWRRTLAKLEQSHLNQRSNKPDRLNLLLILGPSRSGKSTLEMMLSRSPCLVTRYEGITVGDVNRTLKDFKSQSGTFSQQDLFKRLFHVSNIPDDIQSLYVTCTNPSLYRSLDVLMEIIESLYVIYVERDETELLVDIYLKRYRIGHKWSYDINHTKKFLAAYHTAMKVIEKKLRNRFLRVSRDDLLLSPQREVERIAKFIQSPLTCDLSNIYIPQDKGYYTEMLKHLNNALEKNGFAGMDALSPSAGE